MTPTTRLRGEVAAAAVAPASALPSAPRRLDGAELRRRIQALPALPQAVMEALAILRDERARVDDCAERIAVDPALTARALRLANSAFYGVSGRVASLSDAVHLLGRHTLSTLLTAATVTAQFSGGAALRNHQGFWRHTLGVALVSQTLAASRGLDAEIAFTAGLLHDIGQLALAAYYPDELGAAIALARERDIELVQAELLILGQDHTHVGTLVARHWRLPDSVVEAIAWHHQPSAGLAGAGGHRSAGGTMVMVGPHSPCLADIVHLADAVAHALDLGRAPHELVPELDEAAWDRVGLEVDEAQTLFSYAERGVTALGLALGL